MHHITTTLRPTQEDQLDSCLEGRQPQTPVGVKYRQRRYRAPDSQQDDNLSVVSSGSTLTFSRFDNSLLELQTPHSQQSEQSTQQQVDHDFISPLPPLPPAPTWSEPVSLASTVYPPPPATVSDLQVRISTSTPEPKVQIKRKRFLVDHDTRPSAEVLRWKMIEDPHMLYGRTGRNNKQLMTYRHYMDKLKTDNEPPQSPRVNDQQEQQQQEQHQRQQRSSEASKNAKGGLSSLQPSDDHAVGLVDTTHSTRNSASIAALSLDALLSTSLLKAKDSSSSAKIPISSSSDTKDEGYHHSGTDMGSVSENEPKDNEQEQLVITPAAANEDTMKEEQAGQSTEIAHANTSVTASSHQSKSVEASERIQSASDQQDDTAKDKENVNIFDAFSLQFLSQAIGNSFSNREEDSIPVAGGDGISPIVSPIRPESELFDHPSEDDIGDNGETDHRLEENLPVTPESYSLNQNMGEMDDSHRPRQSRRLDPQVNLTRSLITQSDDHQKRTKSNSKLPYAISKAIFSSALPSQTSISSGAHSVIEEMVDYYWKQLHEDLTAYADHADKDVIDKEEIKLLMMRQRLLTKSTSIESLAHEHLPREVWDEICSSALADNQLYPSHR